MLIYIRGFLSFKKDERAVTAVEYALIAAFIAAALIAALPAVTNALGNGFGSVHESIQKSPTSGEGAIGGAKGKN